MKGFCLDVSGRFACFTRPEMKVERVSYDVITPSAARAIYSAIFWKPAIRWRITRIDVLNPILWTTIRRNEVASVASTQSKQIFIEDDRQQRAALILRDVRYRLYAEFDFIPVEQRPAEKNKKAVPDLGLFEEPAPVNPLVDAEENTLVREAEAVSRPDEKEAKYAAMFDRRASKGQYFTHPYLGCREFACEEIKLIKNPESDPAVPIQETRDLGFMLYDMNYSDPQNIKPMFYRPKMENGVIRVPSPDSAEVFQ